jgi:hypothetical protein
LAIGGSQHSNPLQDHQINLRVRSMTSSLAPSPAPGYPPHGNQAVAVTAASNGAGNPYVLVTPASATPSTCQCE